MSDPDAQWGRYDPPSETPPRDPDIPSLLAWAAASCGQHFADRLRPTMTAALSAGWSKNRWAAEACRLILSEDGDPQEITDATRDPLGRRPDIGGGPTPEWQQARADMERRAAL